MRTGEPAPESGQMVKRVDSGTSAPTGTSSLTSSCLVPPLCRMGLMAAASLCYRRDETKLIHAKYLEQCSPTASASCLTPALEAQKRKLPSLLTKDCGQAFVRRWTLLEQICRDRVKAPPSCWCSNCKGTEAGQNRTSVLPPAVGSEAAESRCVGWRAHLEREPHCEAGGGKAGIPLDLDHQAG